MNIVSGWYFVLKRKSRFDLWRDLMDIVSLEEWKQTVKYYRSDAINGEPGTIKNPAVAKSIIFCNEDKGFPEKSPKASKKEEVDQQGKLHPV